MSPTQASMRQQRRILKAGEYAGAISSDTKQFESRVTWHAAIPHHRYGFQLLFTKYINVLDMYELTYRDYEFHLQACANDRIKTE